PRRDSDLLVGLGAAGEDEIAAVRRHPGPVDGDAERLLGFPLAGAHRGGAAFGGLMRQEMAGRDPERGGGHQADGGDAARFHRELSSFSGARGSRLAARILVSATPFGRPRSMWRVVCLKIGSTAFGAESVFSGPG